MSAHVLFGSWNAASGALTSILVCIRVTLNVKIILFPSAGPELGAIMRFSGGSSESS